MRYILLFTVFILITGCGFSKSSVTELHEIKPFEDIMERDYKRLRFAEELTIVTAISSQIIISRATPDNFIEYLKASLKILPMTDSRQKVSDLEIIPSGKISGNTLEFRLDYPSPGSHEFEVKAKIVLRNEFVKVSNKTPFPLQVLSPELIRYTKPSSNIDSGDEEIRALASSIAEGEDDLYRVVFKLAKWVRQNVETGIDTSTIYNSQKASWVLEHKKGVCDEKTSLFIGLLRSSGIPAKFIIGFAGLNYNDKFNFKPHGWAEVYFPSAGWIPFDISYNQLGVIDATHIKLTESVDTADPITSFEWKSVAVSVSPDHVNRESDNPLVSIKDLEIGTKIKNITGTVTPLLELKPQVWHQNTDTGSYNVIEAEIINPHNFYVATEIGLLVPDGLEVLEENRKTILMEPDTKTTAYWIVKPNLHINDRTVVSFPIDIVSSESPPSSIKFSVAKTPAYPRYGLERLKKEIKKKSVNAR